MDGSGNVFVTGSSSGSGGYFDYATIGYSGAGVPLWTNCYNGPGNDEDSAKAVAVDGSGNVFVTGSSSGSGSSWDYATIAYSRAGVPLWTNRYNGPANGSDSPGSRFALALGPDGAVYITGASDGNYSGDGTSDYATVKYVLVPTITSAALTGGDLVLGGTGGRAGGTYYVLASTDLATPMSDWVRLATNAFGVGGGFSATNPVTAGQQYFRIQVP